MQEETIRALSVHRAQIRARWEAFLRIEPVTSPLANPDTLVFGINDALKDIFAALRQQDAAATDAPLTDCSCGRNPLHAFYVAGEQALLESLVLVQAGQPALDAVSRDRDFGDLRRAIRTVARREIGTLASICQLEPEKSAGKPGPRP